MTPDPGDGRAGLRSSLSEGLGLGDGEVARLSQTLSWVVREEALMARWAKVRRDHPEWGADSASARARGVLSGALLVEESDRLASVEARVDQAVAVDDWAADEVRGA